MSASTTTASPNDRQTWRSLLLGAVIWFLHQNVVYSMTSLACKWGWFPRTIAGIPELQFIQIVLTILSAVLLVVLIYLPWRNWRRFQTDRDHVLRDTENDRRPLMSFVTMLVNAVFLLFVMASLVPVMALNPCG
jgi:hypothetical protein